MEAGKHKKDGKYLCAFSLFDIYWNERWSSDLVDALCHLFSLLNNSSFLSMNQLKEQRVSFV